MIDLAKCPKKKFAFLTLGAAQQECRRIGKHLALCAHHAKKATGVKQPKPEKVRPYICGHCGQWHVGRGPKGTDAEWSTRRVVIREHRSV